MALASRHASVVVSRLGWWLASGLAYVAVVVAARFYISALTSQHYEQRARDAYRAQKVLRKISFAASRASERPTIKRAPSSPRQTLRAFVGRALQRRSSRAV